MEPLTVNKVEITPFKIPLSMPLPVLGVIIKERAGFYITLHTSSGLYARGEIAPLEGLSVEGPRRVKHDLKEAGAYLKNFKVPLQKEELIECLRHEANILNACSSVRFGIESALFLLAAAALKQELVEFLGGTLKDVQTAMLLEGSHSQVLSDFKRFSEGKTQVFKLKVGDRNIALDIKKVEDIRLRLAGESYLRLDANRQWTLKEACVFAQMIGNQRIDFIEDPIDDMGQLDAFYQKTRMRVALDETLRVAHSPLTEHEGVVAYVIKPMILGFMTSLDWIDQAKASRRKAIISSAFESPVGLKVLAHLACYSGQIAGVGIERWFKNVQPLVSDGGIIKKEAIQASHER
ncbi:MAG: o-succinylbenzoate synthase [Candidatus Omnitrophica bacterium]|nr:o-succinylbenzoate synthase [Candidatus Omnitrophota bacterium]